MHLLLSGKNQELHYLHPEGKSYTTVPDSGLNQAGHPDLNQHETIRLFA